MPNWCYTSYAIEGQRKEVQSLYSLMNRLEKRKTSLVDNGFGKTWLGNLVTSLGGDWNEIRCRGEWYNLTYDKTANVLRFSTETAWSPVFETFTFVREKYPSLKIYFMATEEGMEIYETNDIEGNYFPERYYLDCYDEPQYWLTLDDAVKYISELIGREVKPGHINEALEAYTEEQAALGKDVFYSFHKYELVDDDGTIIDLRYEKEKETH